MATALPNHRLGKGKRVSHVRPGDRVVIEPMGGANGIEWVPAQRVRDSVVLDVQVIRPARDGRGRLTHTIMGRVVSDGPYRGQQLYTIALYGINAIPTAVAR